MNLENKTTFAQWLVKDLFFNHNSFSFLKGKLSSVKVPMECHPLGVFFQERQSEREE